MTTFLAPPAMWGDAGADYVIESTGAFRALIKRLPTWLVVPKRLSFLLLLVMHPCLLLERGVKEYCWGHGTQKRCTWRRKYCWGHESQKRCEYRYQKDANGNWVTHRP